MNEIRLEKQSWLFNESEPTQLKDVIVWRFTAPQVAGPEPRGL